MERSIEFFALIHLAIMGLSHLVQPLAWVEFFTILRGKGHPGVFVHGFLTLGFGSIIVAFHNVWTGIPAVLTVLGWLYVVKALATFVHPAAGLRSLDRVSPGRRNELRGAGVVFLVIACLLAWHLWL